MDIISEIRELLPAHPELQLDWTRIEHSFIGGFLKEMQKTPQNPDFHGEGDVYIHTKMVCQELTKNSEFYRCLQWQQIGLFLAALLHDLGKTRTTRMEDGKWTSPHHSATGSLMVREFLWKTCGLCGTSEKQRIRELVCSLVRHHMLAVHMLEKQNPDYKLRKTASVGEMAADFSWHLLCLLSEADVKGRIAPDIGESLEKIDLCRVMAQEAGCFDAPYLFRDRYTKRAYFSGRNVMPDQVLYNDTWGEVILLSGLPGTGKDTYIQEHLSELPMISLDEIRKECKIKPTDRQDIVIQTAKERAKEYLRRKQPFVWNATNITQDIRQKQISLFERYGASVRIIYLETDWKTQMERNKGRDAFVPEKVIEKMLAKTVPPTPDEAEDVEWHCV